MCPDTGEEVGLKFQSHGQFVGLLHARKPLAVVNIVADSQQLLDVMPHLMSDHIGLSKVARSSQADFHVVIEAQIDIHLLVRRAVEGAGRRTLKSTRGLNRIPEAGFRV